MGSLFTDHNGSQQMSKRFGICRKIVWKQIQTVTQSLFEHKLKASAESEQILIVYSSLRPSGDLVLPNAC